MRFTDVLYVDRCYICDATQKEMNDLSKCLNKGPEVSKFDFGLRPLHSHTTIFHSCFLQNYFKKWQVRLAERKFSLAQRKELIQQQFKEKIDLIVDKTGSEGIGASNHGNCTKDFP